MAILSPMTDYFVRTAAITCLFALVSTAAIAQDRIKSDQSPPPTSDPKTAAPRETPKRERLQPKTAIFAGGCFWSVETDFERAPGVLDVVAGYTGGRTKNPTYKTYALGGHREAVLITYDPTQITYAGLVEFSIKHSNPIDRGGSFIDRGSNYAAAIYYADEEEKAVAEEVIKKIDALKVYRSAINLPVTKRSAFYPAEAYHQDYHSKNPGGYGDYRAGCGRDEFILKHWGAKADFLTLPGAFPDAEATEPTTIEKERAQRTAEIAELVKPWSNFKKPTPTALKKKLSKMQYQVTQEQFTEKPFDNELWKESAPGIYVDIVSGEPLFSSSDKLDIKDGWPAFSKPIVPGAVQTHKVGSKELTYIEARSQYGDSYLGRVLSDSGDSATRRISVNAAALRFISLDKMEKEGYGAFIPFVRSKAKPEP